jgi:hypothetical protein
LLFLANLERVRFASIWQRNDSKRAKILSPHFSRRRRDAATFQENKSVILEFAERMRVKSEDLMLM